VELTNRAWVESQSQLDRLLELRIEALLARMRLSLAVTGVLTDLSVVIAVATHRHIVRPSERLANVASKVRETKDYDLRHDDHSTNEIGRLGTAFNEMLAELAAARTRERYEQSELARVSRLTTVGVMTASIAHEIKQPLAAIVANGEAMQGWLLKPSPDFAKACSALDDLIEDGHRADRIVDSVRTMFNSRDKKQIDVNDLLEGVLSLVRNEIQKQGISVRIDLLREIPPCDCGREPVAAGFH
jgi:signal transduction histidine kinase